ncbi:MAG: hypothetical protein ACK5OA_04655, partial [Acidovorax sp.]
MRCTLSLKTAVDRLSSCRTPRGQGLFTLFLSDALRYKRATRQAPLRPKPLITSSKISKMLF